ncbi:unnamed protein product, partial [Musa acuminata var. zebrina]
MTAISRSPRDVSFESTKREFSFGGTCSDSNLIFSISKEEEYSDRTKALFSFNEEKKKKKRRERE